MIRPWEWSFPGIFGRWRGGAVGKVAKPGRARDGDIWRRARE